jgi:hypothetical protein
MAKQAIDKKTKEMPLDHKFQTLIGLLESIAHVDSKARKLQEQFNKLNNEKVELEAMGVIYAGTTMRDGKYLYLVYPSKNGEARERKYIGAEPDKIAEAMAAIKRGEDLIRVNVFIEKLELMVSSAEYYVKQGGYQIR